MNAIAERLMPEKARTLLETGDRMDADEFWRRYEQMSGMKAELIGRIVYMASPVLWDRHMRPQYHLAGILLHYATA